MNMQRSRGTTTVEFSIVAAVVFTLIFAVLEVGRGYFIYSMLEEVGRRGSRLAAVCPVNDPAVPRLAVFNASADASPSQMVRGLTPGQVVIDYLDTNGVTVADPSNPANFTSIHYVRARVIGYVFSVNVPLLAGIADVTMPDFESILPRESLGVTREGVITPC
jgi:Flp pilus assembly protein TadG